MDFLKKNKSSLILQQWIMHCLEKGEVKKETCHTYISEAELNTLIKLISQKQLWYRCHKMVIKHQQWQQWHWESWFM